MNTKLAMVGLLAMLTLPACQSGSSVSGDGLSGGGLPGGGEGTFASAMSQVDAGRTAVLLWVQGIACPF